MHREEAPDSKEMFCETRRSIPSRRRASVAATIRALAHPSTKPDDFNRPGHIFPLRARPGMESTVGTVMSSGLQCAEWVSVCS